MRYTRVLTLIVAATASLALATDAAASHRRHGGYSGPFLRPSFGFYAGPFYGYYGNPWWGPIGAWGYYGMPYPAGAWQGAAELRIQVAPKQAEVYVDGYYAGVVDDFDGTFQRLRLQPGNHSLVLYLEGYHSVRQDIHVGPGSSFKIKHTMEELGPGQSDDPRPEPPPDAAPAAPAPPPADFALEPPPEPARPARPAPPRREAPPATEGRFGQLVLHTQPGGVEVWIDGQRWPADSNGSLTLHLPAGVHRIELRRAGRQPFATEMEIRTGEARELNVQLPSDGSSL